MADRLPRPGPYAPSTEWAAWLAENDAPGRMEVIETKTSEIEATTELLSASIVHTFPVLVEVDSGRWVSLDQVVAITQTDCGALVFLVGGMQIATSNSAAEVVAMLRAAAEVAGVAS